MAKRRIGGAGSGSDKGKSTAGVVAAGVVLAGLVAYSGGTVGGGAGSGTAARSVVNKADAKKFAKSGRGDAWGRMGMRAGKRVTRTATNCAAHSSRDIRAFFLRTPCRALNRMIYPVTLEGGAVVAVSVVWVDFRTTGQAKDFQVLHRIHGNGDITPLGAPLLGLDDITFTALNYDSRVSGKSVVIAETEAAGGSVSRDVLDAVAEVAAAFPKP